MFAPRPNTNTHKAPARLIPRLASDPPVNNRTIKTHDLPEQQWSQTPKKDKPEHADTCLKKIAFALPDGSNPDEICPRAIRMGNHHGESTWVFPWGFPVGTSDWDSPQDLPREPLSAGKSTWGFHMVHPHGIHHVTLGLPGKLPVWIPCGEHPCRFTMWIPRGKSTQGVAMETTMMIP